MIDGTLGKNSPYIFVSIITELYFLLVPPNSPKDYLIDQHMCWTQNKVDKLKFMKQMGMWHVKDNCIGQDAKELHQGGSAELSQQCCSAEPLIECFFRDKASVIPCKDSPTKDRNAVSFWS